MKLYPRLLPNHLLPIRYSPMILFNPSLLTNHCYSTQTTTHRSFLPCLLTTDFSSERSLSLHPLFSGRVRYRWSTTRQRWKGNSTSLELLFVYMSNVRTLIYTPNFASRAARGRARERWYSFLSPLLFCKSVSGRRERERNCTWRCAYVTCRS